MLYWCWLFDLEDESDVFANRRMSVRVAGAHNYSFDYVFKMIDRWEGEE